MGTFVALRSDSARRILEPLKIRTLGNTTWDSTMVKNRNVKVSSLSLFRDRMPIIFLC